MWYGLLVGHHGVTAPIFSDFRPRHEITGELRELTRLLETSNVEVITEATLLQIQGVDCSSTKEKNRFIIIVTVAQSDHGLDD